MPLPANPATPTSRLPRHAPAFAALVLFLAAMLRIGPPAAARPGPDRPAQPARAAAATWTIQSSPTELTLNGVAFIDSCCGWIVGGEGEHNEKCVILRTSDGGVHWQPLTCPVPLKLNAVSFVDARNGWAVGVDGLIIRTADGGDTWARQDSTTGNRITSVQFIDALMGWATVSKAAFVLKTVDGGGTWRQVALKKQQDLSRLSFLDRQHGWALGGDGVLLATTDGGETWADVDFGTKDRMYAVQFADLQHGWVAGARIRATTDGGNTWSAQPQPDNTVQEIVFFDALQGYAVGDEGLFQHTADGGATWQRQQQGLTHLALRDLSAPNPRWLWAVGVKGLIVRGHDPDGVVGSTATPTRMPTPTRTPTPTPSPTPTATATPTGPWVRVGESNRPLLIPPDGRATIEVAWGNMSPTVDLVAALSGPVVFADGQQSFTTSISRSSGAGSYALVVVAQTGAAPGERFSLQVTVGGTPVGRPGTIAWRAWLPWVGRTARLTVR